MLVIFEPVDDVVKRISNELAPELVLGIVFLHVMQITSYRAITQAFVEYGLYIAYDGLEVFDINYSHSVAIVLLSRIVAHFNGVNSFS